MDHYLKNINNGVDRESPVRYFVMGSDEWRESKTWLPAAKSTLVYLSSGGENDGPFNIGPLSSAAPQLLKNSGGFISDPEHPVKNTYASSGAHDYRDLPNRLDTLMFDSAPMTSDLEVAGPIQAEVYTACDCRDMDLWVRLLDVAPDGTAFNLMNPGLTWSAPAIAKPGRSRSCSRAIASTTFILTISSLATFSKKITASDCKFPAAFSRTSRAIHKLELPNATPPRCERPV
jgi:putative CocE/NonD family hydrolase